MTVQLLGYCIYIHNPPPPRHPPAPPLVEDNEIFRGKLYKLRIFLGVE